jgi:4-diphosphocytidyl-2-C-methyl-D-erythritol kinase
MTPRAPLVERAHAKVNLLLHVGRRRDDGLHELCSLFASIGLADEVCVEPAEHDALVCPGVEGPNLASRALEAFRAAAAAKPGGVALPPLRIEIEKRIPVAAGLGGGSADAAAVLRAANRLAGEPLTSAELRTLGAALGADVPSQVEPRHALVAGAGERVEPIALPALALVLVPAAEGLSTAAVYAEADRLPSTRARLDPERVRALAAAPLPELAAALENDLEPAALSLRPELGSTLGALRSTGALAARITGSGPTAFGVFPDERAARAAADGIPGALVTTLRDA